ncbi:hypothetical protein TPA0909_21030 [Streptomyces albus]|nr:hypothetical protein TPA0909_21030 [Streptomyces albus]
MKTRKIVPSPIPAARAIFAVVTSGPYSMTSGSAAVTIIARRCSALIAGALRLAWDSFMHPSYGVSTHSVNE